jgi:hypothetical protein
MFATSAAAATAAAAVFTTTAAATRTLFARAGDIDGNSASIQFDAVHGGDGFLGFLFCAHGHKTKATGAIGGAVNHEVRFGNCAVCCERVIERVLGGIEGKISYKQFIIHVMYCLLDGLAGQTVPVCRISNHH